ncbi:ABC transporter ATP-binding protein [Paenibacillus sp. GD4]|uniref:ABC transporter ATP-binding protein n=1 Tax=Paenibacillus sp. GD4 TaxID=3068890 RepID=UPI002796917C|nr:ABC transporter ATP-binding protein [Paenibacillus sp. GD4]MDQ1911633.1 ABC transporter ATP-binding protein [Paenibacillus sp. GD4]
MVTVEVSNIWKKFSISSNRVNSLSQIFSLRKEKRNKEITKDFWALKDISFKLEKGESLGIVGSNGSGKSTLLKLLTGIMSPTKGVININGKISAMIELGAGFHPDFSGRDNVFINGMMLGMTKKEIAKKFDEIVDFAEIESFIDVPVKYYSSGMQARLGFSVATSVDPQILIVDEVLAVGDVEFQKKCKNRIKQMISSGTSLLLVSHGASDIEEICQKALWINKGETKMFADAKTVMNVYQPKEEKDA